MGETSVWPSWMRRSQGDSVADFLVKVRRIARISMASKFVNRCMGLASVFLAFGHDINYPLFNATATAQNVDARRPIQPGILR